MLGFDEIHIATPRDEDELFALLMMLHGENALFPVSEPKVRDTIRIATEAKGGLIGLIRGPAGLEASIGLYLETWWYTDDFSLNEKWNFVHPDHRQTTHAKRLIEFAKKAADELHVLLNIGIMSTERTAAKVRLYQRQLQQVGAYFMHGIPDDLVSVRHGRQN